jgi:hypothetical protein
MANQQKRGKTMKKSIILAMLLLTQSIVTMAGGSTGQITNNSNGAINIVFYSNYIAPTPTRSAQGRISSQGTVITAGQNCNFPPGGVTSVEIFYGNGTLPPLHMPVSTGLNYTINPGAQWTITQD